MKACKRAVDLIHMPTIAGPLPLLKTSIMAINHQAHQFSQQMILTFTSFGGESIIGRLTCS